MNKERQAVAANWLKFLDPEQIKANLQVASLFLTAWELLKDSIVEETRQFFCHTYRDGKWIADPQYGTDVLSRHKDPVHASCLWLKEMEAIDGEDIKKVEAIRTHRNDLAHELMKYLADVNSTVDVNLFHDMYAILTKIDRWRAINVHAATDPDLYDKDIDKERVQSGRMMSLWLILQVLSGDDIDLPRMREIWEKDLNDDQADKGNGGMDES